MMENTTFSYVRPIFHSDGHAKWCLDKGPRHCNVLMNRFGHYFIDGARLNRDKADGQLWRNRHGMPIYRIIVRLKCTEGEFKL